MKRDYITPAVLRQETIQLEKDFLTESVSEKNNSIESKGQDVMQYDASAVTFNHTWED
ncbi:MAG: hypothetical protein J6W82_01650 [Bacteroidales bacterium]|nr:hypothetical protein [Bacteroidales bacterium]